MEVRPHKRKKSGPWAEHGRCVVRPSLGRIQKKGGESPSREGRRGFKCKSRSDRYTKACGGPRLSLIRWATRGNSYSQADEILRLRPLRYGERPAVVSTVYSGANDRRLCRFPGQSTAFFPLLSPFGDGTSNIGRWTVRPLSSSAANTVYRCQRDCRYLSEQQVVASVEEAGSTLMTKHKSWIFIRPPCEERTVQAVVCVCYCEAPTLETVGQELSNMPLGSRKLQVDERACAERRE